MQVIERLASRFTKSTNVLKTLTVLTNIKNVVVAGGSAAFPNIANDVDVFILNEDFNAWQSALLLFGEYSKECFYMKNDDYERRLTSFSVVEIRIQDEIIPFQFIFTDFTSTELLLANFDFDYIRIGVHLGALCFDNVEQYQEAHQTKKISWCSDRDAKIFRFQKAIAKGFQTPIICNKYVKESHAQYESERFCKLTHIVPTNMKTKTSTNLCLSAFKITGINFENMRDSKYLLFPLVELKDEAGNVLHAKYVSVVVYVLDEYNIQLADKSNSAIFKVKNKSDTKLESKRSYNVVIELALVKNDHKIMCYIVEVNDSFLPLPVSETFWRSMEDHLISKWPGSFRTSLEHKIMKWETSTDQMDNLFGQVARLLLTEKSQIVPNYRSVTKILDNDIYKYCGDASLLMERGSMQTFEDAERYLNVQYTRFAGTKFTQSDYSQNPTCAIS